MVPYHKCIRGMGKGREMTRKFCWLLNLRSFLYFRLISHHAVYLYHIFVLILFFICTFLFLVDSNLFMTIIRRHLLNLFVLTFIFLLFFLYSIPDFRGWYGSYGIILRENGRDTAPDPHNDELHRLIEKKLSKKRVEMMEKYGSAVMTDPSLIKQLEEHKVDLDKEKDRLADNFEKRQTRKKEYPSLKGIQGLCGDYPVNERDCLFVIRRYNVGSAWRSTLHQVSKIKLYMHGKRDNLHLSEDRKVPMRGIMALVFGFFSLVNCLLLGQFTVPTEDKHSSSQKKQKKRLMTIPLGG